MRSLGTVGKHLREREGRKVLEMGVKTSFPFWPILFPPNSATVLQTSHS